MNSLKLAVYSSICLYFARKILNKGGHPVHRIKTNTHAIKSAFSLVDEDDISCLHGLDVEKYMLEYLENEVQNEIQNEIAEEIISLAKTYSGNGILRVDCRVNPTISVDSIRISTRVVGDHVSSCIIR